MSSQNHSGDAERQGARTLIELAKEHIAMLQRSVIDAKNALARSKQTLQQLPEGRE